MRSSVDKGSPVTGSDPLICNNQNFVSADQGRHNWILWCDPVSTEESQKEDIKNKNKRNHSKIWTNRLIEQTLPQDAWGSTSSRTASQICVTPQGLQVSHLILKPQRKWISSKRTLNLPLVRQTSTDTAIRTKRVGRTIQQTNRSLEFSIRKKHSTEP